MYHLCIHVGRRSLDQEISPLLHNGGGCVPLLFPTLRVFKTALARPVTQDTLDTLNGGVWPRYEIK
jgi:hypothetical protein